MRSWERESENPSTNASVRVFRFYWQQHNGFNFSRQLNATVSNEGPVLYTGTAYPSLILRLWNYIKHPLALRASATTNIPKYASHILKLTWFIIDSKWRK